MADYNSSMESGSSAEEASSVVHPLPDGACGVSIWEGWTQPSSGDGVATSNSLSELSGSTQLSFHQADVVANWLMSQAGSSLCVDHRHDHADQPTSFIADHGLVSDMSMCSSQSINGPEPSSHISSELSELYIGSSTKQHSEHTVYGPVTPDFQGVESYSKCSSHYAYGKPLESHAELHLLQSLNPESPSSPLAPEAVGQWDGSHGPVSTWASPGPTSQPLGSSLQLTPGKSSELGNHLSTQPHCRRVLFPDTSVDRYYNNYANTRQIGTEVTSLNMIDQLETLLNRNVNSLGSNPEHLMEHLIGSTRGTYSASAGLPHFSNIPGSPVPPLRLIPSLHDGKEDSINYCPADHPINISSVLQGTRDHSLSREDQTSNTTAGFKAGEEQERSSVNQPRQVQDGNGGSPPLKRPSLDTAALWQRSPIVRRVEAKPFSSTSSSYMSGSQSQDTIAVGPALNTNGKPRARRGSATDPQSVYARHRRERINERLKTLQHLVPNGAKVDIVTMLEEAINYVKFLQLQVKLLKSDEYWIYATPNTYNGIDVSVGMHFGMESTA